MLEKEEIEQAERDAQQISSQLLYESAIPLSLMLRMQRDRDPAPPRIANRSEEDPYNSLFRAQRGSASARSQPRRPYEGPQVMRSIWPTSTTSNQQEANNDYVIRPLRVMHLNSSPAIMTGNGGSAGNGGSMILSPHTQNRVTAAATRHRLQQAVTSDSTAAIHSSIGLQNDIQSRMQNLERRMQDMSARQNDEQGVAHVSNAVSTPPRRGMDPPISPSSFRVQARQVQQDEDNDDDDDNDNEVPMRVQAGVSVTTRLSIQDNNGNDDDDDDDD